MVKTQTVEGKTGVYILLQRGGNKACLISILFSPINYCEYAWVLTKAFWYL